MPTDKKISNNIAGLFILFVSLFVFFPGKTAAVTCEAGKYLWCINAAKSCSNMPYDVTTNDAEEQCKRLDQRLGNFTGLTCTNTVGEKPAECAAGANNPNVGTGIGCCVVSAPSGKKCVDLASSNQKDLCTAGAAISGVALTAWAAGVGWLSGLVDLSGVQFMEPAQCQQEPTCPTYKAPSGGGGGLKQVETNFTPIKPLLQINIPTVNFSDITVQGETGSRYVDIPYLAEYIKGVFNYALGLLAMIAIIMIMIGGVRYIMARGGGGVGEAKKMIGNAVFGLILGLLSFVILNAVSPSLTNLSTLRTTYIERQTADVEYPPPPTEPASAENDGSSPPPGGKVPFFGQYVATWGGITPNGQGAEDPKCQTIKARGCGITSLAMVLKFYGKNVTPKDTGLWGLNCGTPPPGAWQPPPSLANSPWSDLTMGRVPVETAMQLAAQGRPIVFNCAPCVGYRQNGSIKSYRGHYMVLTGSTDGGQTFTVNDPGANLNSGIVKMTREQVINPLVTDWQKDCSNDSCRNNYSGSRVVDGKIQRAFKFGLYVHP